MEHETPLAVPIQEKLPMKKKGWRRFLSFFTSGKPKSKEVVEMNHKDVTTEAQIHHVRSEAAVLLNSEAVRIAENLPEVSKKRKLLSLQRMFGKKNSSKDREKSANKIFSSKTYVEVYDFSDKLTENDKAVDEYFIEVSEAKIESEEQVESQLYSEIDIVTSASDNNDDSEANKKLFESLSDCPLMSEVGTMDRNLLSLGSSVEVDQRVKKGNFRRFFRNRFGRRSPSKMNLSSKTIVEAFDEDKATLEETSTEYISNEVQGVEKNDEPLGNEESEDKTLLEDRNTTECQIVYVEHQLESDVTQVDCEINMEQSESVKPADDTPEVESNDLEMSKKATYKCEIQIICSPHNDGIPEAENMPAESKNKVDPDQTYENASSRPESPKKDADSKDYKIFKNHQPSKIHRIKKLRFNLPTIDELPENEATNSDALEAVDSTKTDQEIAKKESKLEAVTIDDILLNEEIKPELIQEDKTVPGEDKLCELLIGDNPNVGQDNCENSLLSSDEGDTPKTSNDKKLVEVTEVLTEQI